MRILVLNGSPKRERSDTLHITRAFLAGIEEAARQEIRSIHAIDKHIEACTGCFACMRNGGTFVHEDDMREILGEIGCSAGASGEPPLPSKSSIFCRSVTS